MHRTLIKKRYFSVMNTLQPKSQFVAPLILVVGNVLLICFHAAVLLHMVPSSLVWSGGNRVQGDVMKLEIVSLLLAFVFLAISWSGRRAIQLGRPSRWVRAATIALTAIYTLSIVANIASANPVEQMIFIPVSTLFAVCAFVSTRSLPKNISI